MQKLNTITSLDAFDPLPPVLGAPRKPAKPAPGPVWVPVPGRTHLWQHATTGALAYRPPTPPVPAPAPASRPALPVKYMGEEQLRVFHKNLDMLNTFPSGIYMVTTANNFTFPRYWNKAKGTLSYALGHICDKDDFRRTVMHTLTPFTLGVNPIVSIVKVPECRRLESMLPDFLECGK